MLATVLLTVIVVLLIYVFWKHKQFADTLPPGPPSLPIVGNLLQLDRKDPRKTYVKWYKKYGPIYTVWLGVVPTIFISSAELLHEIFVKRGDEFSERPNTFIFNVFSKGSPGGISNASGLIWKEQRRFSLHTLRNFGLGRKLMEEKIAAESAKLVSSVEKSLEGERSNVISTKSFIEVCVGNVISSIIFGHTYHPDDPVFVTLKHSLETVLRLIGNDSIQLLESLPWLRHVPYYGRLGFDEFNENNEKILKILSDEIEVHKEKFGDKTDPNDFIDAYLIELQRRKDACDMSTFSEWQLVCVLYDLWGASMETTNITMRWAILLMMHHPEVQEKVKQEIKSVIGLERLPNWNDRTMMPYTCATIQEVQRFANIFSYMPHTVKQDVVINGYNIPKNIAINPQVSVVHFDDAVYKDPYNFYPDRYLENDGKTTKKIDFTFLPFSLGKRLCPGEGLARMELYLMFSSLLQKFSFSFDTSQPKPSLDPVIGFLMDAQPYVVRVTLNNLE